MVLECFFAIAAEGSWNFTLLVVHTMYRWKRHWGFYYVSTAEQGTFLKRLEAGCIAQKEKSNFLLEKGVVIVQHNATPMMTFSPTFACFTVCYGFALVSVKSFLTVVAVASSRVMSTFKTHATTAPPGQ